MKTKLTIATILLLLAAMVHTIGGELTNIQALMETTITANMKMEMRAVWYLVAIDFFVSAAYLFYFIRSKKFREQKVLINFIGIRMLLYGFTFLILILLTNVNLLFQVPQWILLIGIGMLLEWDFLFKNKTKLT